MKKLLRSTTSLGLSLALAFPHGAFAQQQDAPVCAPVGETSEFPCRFDDQVVNDAEELRVAAELAADAEANAAAEGEATAEAEADAEGEATAEADGETVLEEAGEAAEAAGEAAEEAVNAAEEQAEEAEAAVETQANEAADAAEDTAEAAKSAIEGEAQVETEATAETEAPADMETTAEADANTQADGEAATEETLSESDQIRLERGAVVDVKPEVAEEAEAPEVSEGAAEESSAEAETATEAEAPAEAEATAEAPANTETTAEAEAPVSAEAEDEAAAQAGLTEEERQAREERREQRRAERREQRRAEREAERAAAAAAAAEAAENEEAAEVVTEEVTEEDVRSASEDFETKVTGTGEQAAPAPSDDDDDGMSDFQKALLLGLGAVAVGSVLNNGDKIVGSTGDRVVVQDPNGDLRVLKDDNALLRRPGDTVQTQTFDDGSTRTIVTKADGSRIETIRARDGSVLRRTNFDAQGREYILVDDLVEEREVVVNELPQVRESAEPRRASAQDEEALRQALQAQMSNDQGRTFSLRQVREIREVRALAPELELDAVRFATGSAAIQPEQARALANIGTTLRDLIEKDPRTVILVEGHTDAVGDATYNLALSDRRAETVALALTEYFDVPPENLITQGYGESQLRIPTADAEPANRRAVVRNITGLLR